MAGLIEAIGEVAELAAPAQPGRGAGEKRREQDQRTGPGAVDDHFWLVLANSLDDRLKGLNLGADDYIVKPFHMPELVARINSVFRRRRLLGGLRALFGLS